MYSKIKFSAIVKNDLKIVYEQPPVVIPKGAMVDVLRVFIENIGSTSSVMTYIRWGDVRACCPMVNLDDVGV